MKTKNTLLILVATLLLSACVYDPIYDPATANYGTITLTTDWSGIGSGLTPPASCTVKVGEYSATLPGTTYTIDNLFLAGTYHANIYNTAQHITVNGTTATVAAAPTPAGATGLFIEPLPGWLFTCAMDVTIEENKAHTFNALMQQQVRELILLIEPGDGMAGRIGSITATLSGVASQMNIDNGTAGVASNIVPVFTKITSGPDAGTYQATVHLLDITGSSQQLRLTLTYTDGTPPQEFEAYELNTLLAGFGADKRTPLTLGTQIVETLTGAGFTATIEAWVELTSTGVAN